MPTLYAQLQVLFHPPTSKPNDNFLPGSGHHLLQAVKALNAKQYVPVLIVDHVHMAMELVNDQHYNFTTWKWKCDLCDTLGSLYTQADLTIIYATNHAKVLNYVNQRNPPHPLSLRPATQEVRNRSQTITRKQSI